MPIVPSPADRLRRVCSVGALVPMAEPVRLLSYSNDVWGIEDTRLGSIVLRVAWRGDLDRFAREVAIVRRLPQGIRYPDLVDHGTTDLGGFPLAYIVTKRLTGRSWDSVWECLPESARHSAVDTLAVMLRELHAWRPPADLAAMVAQRPGLRAGGITELMGADLTPLPAARAITLARHAMTLPHVDPGLMTDAIDILREFACLTEDVDDSASHGMVHGDLQLTNLLWNGSGEICLLDLEWARFGPPLLDVQRLCENADDDVRNGSDVHPAILRRLADEYPEICKGTRLPERLRVYSLAYSIRHIIVAPPDRPASELPAGHSLLRLRRLVDGSWPARGALPEILVSD